MSQTGYGYGVPQGRHPEPAYSNLPYLAYQTSQPSNEPTDVAAEKQRGATQQPLGGRHNMIPGLGLGLSASGTEQQKSWSEPQLESWHPRPHPPPAGAQDLPQALATANDLAKPSVAMGHGGALDASEEGEVSEGEVEDLYEPKEVGADADTAGNEAWPHDGADLTNCDSAMGRRVAFVPDGYSQSLATGAGTAWPAGPSGQPSTARERSGSYSPYLSPREINPVDVGHTSAYHGSPSPLNEATPQTTSSNELTEPTPVVIAKSGQTVPSPVRTVGTAKQAARNAILRLWPLKISYRNYLEEGIDSAILDGLFRDLGLDVDMNVDVSQDSVPSGPNRAEYPASPESEGVGASQAQPALPRTANTQSSKSIDKSEERKDRIARLLAAKGSKPAATTTVAQPETRSTTTPVTVAQLSTMPKAQSDKSKLLHQKMEALRKAREALAQPGLQQPTSSVLGLPKPETEKGANPDAAAATLNTSVESPSLPELPNQAVGPMDGAATPSPPIPGLFLSSAPQPLRTSELTNQGHQPSPNLSEPHAKSSRRPFGQNMDTRPFLINVSDDEDDADMEIDSPGRRSSPGNRPETPSQHAVVLRHLPPVSNSILVRRAPTPTSVATPPRNSGHSSGGEDLASMNKKIEAMKRKIAEAEARNKAKRSRQVSPTASHSNDSCRDASAEAASLAKGLAVSALSIGRSRTPMSHSPAETVPSFIPPKQRNGSEQTDHGNGQDRRSRSRAASERLPFIEARRKEQLLMVKNLQSQIQNIEREIEQGRREEETLKQDLVTSDSEQDQNQPGPQTAPSPAERGLSAQLVEGMSQSDALDSASGLQDAGGEFGNGHGHGHTPAQAPEQGRRATSQRDIYSGEGKCGKMGPGEARQATSASQAIEAVEVEDMPSAQPEPRKTKPSQDAEHDVLMKDVGDSTGDELEDGSDDYEPPDMELSAMEDTTRSRRQTDAVGEQDILPNPVDLAGKGVSVAAPLTQQQISAGQAEPMPDSGREAKVLPLTQQRSEPPKSEQSHQARQGSTADGRQSHFASYETPLQYFRAYRFHPEFGQSVAGGLRSLTYSNKIDVQKQVCPDELAGQQCPRGGRCEYQHFENMKAPDDQILLQLGAAGNHQTEQKQEYIAGLRQLLTDFRNRKVKDFNTISQGIIDYRARFYGDKSKILPLGGVNI